MSSSPSRSLLSAFPEFTVASVQMEPHVRQNADNLARSIRLIEEAAAQGARVAVLPKLTSSGYVFESREEAFSLAEEISYGDCTQAWTEVAERLKIYVVAGIAERAGLRMFNSAAVVGPAAAQVCIAMMA